MKKRLCDVILQKASAYLFFFVLVLSVFSSSVVATSHDKTATTKASVTANDVDTIIIVNGGDASSIDSAIAASISHDIGVPVLYTEEGKISEEIVKQLESGFYKEVKNVVILGGEAVVSTEVEKSLENSGATLAGNFEVTRIAGTTGTGTAVEAIGYFYGPEVLNEVSIVMYKGDDDKSHDEILHLSSELGKPIIPIPEDVNGLPADVVESLHTLGVDKVDVIGDFKKESEIKSDLKELNVQIKEEISGSVTSIESKLEEEVKDSIKSGDTVIFVEEGDVPPIMPDYKVLYYKDENNDNKDDDSGLALDVIGRDLNSDLNKEGVKIDGINYYGDNDAGLKQVESTLEKEGIKVDVVDYDNVAEVVEKTIDTSKKLVNEIVKTAEAGEEELHKSFDLHKGEFEKVLPEMVGQFKAFYIQEKDKLSSEELRIGAQIIDEANKNDLASEWKLMHAFASEYKHESYVSSCRDSKECVREEVEHEKINVEEKLENVVGTDKAREAANLNVGQKVGLLQIDNFIPPGQENKFSEEVGGILQQGVKLEEVSHRYVEDHKEEAYKKYAGEIKREYESLGRKEDAAKVSIDSVKKDFEKRLVIECESYLGGFVRTQEYIDPAKRAEVYSKMEGVQKELEAKGVKESYYMTSGEWKAAYDQYNKLGGKLNDQDIKRYEAAVTAYKTYEHENQGVAYTPSSGTWDSKSGQFSYLDPEGKLISGVYKEGRYYHTNDEGKLIEGRKDGTVVEHDSSALPGGWKYDDKTGVYSKDGANYMPPSEYNSYSGKYEHYHGGGYVGCGSSGCNVQSTPEGYNRNSDGSWSREDYKGAVNDEWKPGTYYDPRYHGYVPAVESKPVEGTDVKTTTGTTGYSDPYGNTWNHDSSGEWKHSTTPTTTTGTGGATTAAHTSSVTWTQSSDGKTWTSSTGQTSGGTATGTGTGTTTGTSTYHAPGTSMGSVQVDSSGNTWTQDSIGGWTSPTSTSTTTSTTTGGATSAYTPGATTTTTTTGGTTTTTGGTTTTTTTTGTSDGSSWSSSTSTSTYSAPSGGETAPSAPSGGDGGHTGHVVFDPEGKSRGLLRWLIGGGE